jgi:hypothetical protein
MKKDMAVDSKKMPKKGKKKMMKKGFNPSKFANAQKKVFGMTPNK